VRSSAIARSNRRRDQGLIVGVFVNEVVVVELVVVLVLVVIVVEQVELTVRTHGDRHKALGGHHPEIAVLVLHDGTDLELLFLGR
jgi:hypothetical protein